MKVKPTHFRSGLPRAQRAQFGTATALRPFLSYSPEVEDALQTNKPVVAFETTIATHGLPHPQRIDVPLQLEALARSMGVVPATISILRGRVHIGTTPAQLEELVTQPSVLKLSRRDLAAALAQRAFGGTTVAATMRLCALAGVKFFATGGIGGVHRGGENSMDVSADLMELASQPVGVVCAGPKSILDIPRTLEYLETHSVPVTTWQSKEFPAFYARSSGLTSPASVYTAAEAAEVYRQNEIFGQPSGVLFAVPIPEEAGRRAEPIQRAVEQAVKESEENGVARRGKESTPWLLDRVKQLTQGGSVESNIALIDNNTRVACQIAAAYHGSAAPHRPATFQPSAASTGNSQSPESTRSYNPKESNSAEPHNLLVVGGAGLDITSQSRSPTMQMGCTSPGTVDIRPGGVARNVAEATTRLGCRTRLLAGLGKDGFGVVLERDCQEKGVDLVPISAEGHSTAVLTPTLDGKGDLVVGVAAMDIAEHLSTSELQAQLEASTSKMVVFDANISSEAINVIVQHAQRTDKQTFLEPTSIRKCTRILESSTERLPLLDHITPNKDELSQLWQTAQESLFDLPQYTSRLLSFNLDSAFSDALSRTLPKFLTEEGHAQKMIRLLPLFSTIWLKLGPLGCLVGTRAPVSQEWHSSKHTAVGPPSEDGLCVVLRYYPAQPVDPQKIASVIGAGDSFASGLLSRLVENPQAHQSSSSLDSMLHLAQAAAVTTLQSSDAVGVELSKLR